MTWVRLDDQVYSNGKLHSVPRATRWVWVAGLAFSSHNRLDGLVPPWGRAHVEATAADVRALVDAGLWVPDGGAGWRIHDYADYQPVNGELSRKRSEAGRKGAQRRWQT